MKAKLAALGVALSFALTVCPVHMALADEVAKVMTEDQAAQMVSVALTPMVLKSKLKNSYNGYKLTLTNNYPESLEVRSANVVNSVGSQMAYMSEKGSTEMALWFLLVPILWLVVTPIVATTIHSKNKKMRKEAYRYTDQFPMVTIPHGGSVDMNVLTPAGQKPVINVTFKDKVSGLVFTKVQ